MTRRSRSPFEAAVPSRPGSPALSPAAVLLWGLLGAAVCMLLLFGPFHGAHYDAPGRSLERWLVLLLRDIEETTGSRAARQLAYRLQELFVLRLLGAFVLLMALVPFGLALLRQRRARDADETDPAGSTDPGQGAHSALVFLDDGAILGDLHEPIGTLRRDVGALRAMAVAADVPWHTDFETEGGARGFLEILRALEDGPAEVHRAEELDRASTAAPVTESGTGPEAEARPSAAAPSHRPAVPEAETPPGAGDRSAPTDDVQEQPSTWHVAASSSVYTPTTLYSPLGAMPAGSGSSDAAPGADSTAADGADSTAADGAAGTSADRATGAEGKNSEEPGAVGAPEHGR